MCRGCSSRGSSSASIPNLVQEAFSRTTTWRIFQDCVTEVLERARHQDRRTVHPDDFFYTTIMEILPRRTEHRLFFPFRSKRNSRQVLPWWRSRFSRRRFKRRGARFSNGLGPFFSRTLADAGSVRRRADRGSGTPRGLHGDETDVPCHVRWLAWLRPACCRQAVLAKISKAGDVRLRHKSSEQPSFAT